MENANPLTIDATIVFAFISFVIFIFLMHLICYKPIMRIIKEREKLLFKNRQTVDETNKKRDDAIKEFNDEISKSKLESSKLLKESMELNNKKKLDAIQNKKTELSNSLTEYDKALFEQSKKAKEELKEQVSCYVQTTVSKILNVPPDTINVNTEKLDEMLK